MTIEMWDWVRYLVLVMMSGYVVGGFYVIERRNKAHQSSAWEIMWVWSAMAFVITAGVEIALRIGEEGTWRTTLYPFLVGFGLIALWKSARKDR